jgi:hypothetical protein
MLLRYYVREFERREFKKNPQIYFREVKILILTENLTLEKE